MRQGGLEKEGSIAEDADLGKPAFHSRVLTEEGGNNEGLVYHTFADDVIDDKLFVYFVVNLRDMLDWFFQSVVMSVFMDINLLIATLAVHIFNGWVFQPVAVSVSADINLLIAMLAVFVFNGWVFQPVVMSVLTDVNVLTATLAVYGFIGWAFQPVVMEIVSFTFFVFKGCAVQPVVKLQCTFLVHTCFLPVPLRGAPRAALRHAGRCASLEVPRLPGRRARPEARTLIKVHLASRLYMVWSVEGSGGAGGPTPSTSTSRPSLAWGVRRCTCCPSERSSRLPRALGDLLAAGLGMMFQISFHLVRSHFGPVSSEGAPATGRSPKSVRCTREHRLYKASAPERRPSSVQGFAPGPRRGVNRGASLGSVLSEISLTYLPSINPQLYMLPRGIYGSRVNLGEQGHQKLRVISHLSW